MMNLTKKCHFSLCHLCHSCQMKVAQKNRYGVKLSSTLCQYASTFTKKIYYIFIYIWYRVPCRGYTYVIYKSFRSIWHGAKSAKNPYTIKERNWHSLLAQVAYIQPPFMCFLIILNLRSKI